MVAVYMFIGVMGSLLGVKRFPYALLMLPLALAAVTFHVLVRSGEEGGGRCAFWGKVWEAHGWLCSVTTAYAGYGPSIAARNKKVVAAFLVCTAHAAASTSCCYIPCAGKIRGARGGGTWVGVGEALVLVLSVTDATSGTSCCYIQCAGKIRGAKGGGGGTR